MSKQSEIKQVLSTLSAIKGLNLTESKIESLASSLSNLSSATRPSVLSIILQDPYMIKESVDFSDTNYWIDRIVDIINNK